MPELTDTERLNGLRKLCGYIDAGDGDDVTIGQDDVTKEWVLHCGTQWWHSTSFRGVIDEAIKSLQQ